MWQGRGVGSEKISDLLSEGSYWTQTSTLGQFEVKACISTRWIVWLLRVHYCSVWFTKAVLLLVWAVPCWWRWLFKSRFVKWLFGAPKALSPAVVLRLRPEPVGPVAMLCLFKLVTPACLLRPTLGAEGGREASVRPSSPAVVTCPFSGTAHPPWCG